MRRIGSQSGASTSERLTSPATGAQVLLVAPQPLFDDRGTPIAVRQVVEALSQLGYAVDVLTYPIGRDLEIPGVRVLRSGNPFRIRRVPIGFSLRKLALDFSLTATLARVLRAPHAYVCVHAVEEAAFPAIVLCRRRRIPVVYDMQSSLPEQLSTHAPFRVRPVPALLRRAERWLLLGATVVVSSAGLSRRVRSVAPTKHVEEWRYSSIHEPPAPDVIDAVRRSLRLDEDAQVVLYSGTFEPYQGIELLLQAAPLVRRSVPEAVFVLVGATPGSDLPPRLPFETRAAVRVVRRQPKALIPAYAALAAVLVSPRAFGGNVPLKVFDYLAAGRPIVATDVPAHRVVLDDQLALLVRPSPRALAAGIIRVLREPETAERLAGRARAFADDHLDWMSFVKSVGELYAAAQSVLRSSAAA